jgi:hypothetical protein
MALASTGIATAAVAVAVDQAWFGLLAAAVLGAAYGSALVSGLLEIQRLAGPDELGGLTGIYYALAYAGFLLPEIVAAAAHVLSTDTSLWILAAVALACTAIVATGRSLPARA